MARRGKHFHTEPMNTKIDELFATLRGLVSDQSRDLAIAMAELASVAQQRDKLRAELAIANEKMDAQACVLDGCRLQRDAAAIERDHAHQTLRTAESKSAAQGLTLATLCDLVLGEDAQDRSDDALVRAASKLAAERDKALTERDAARAAHSELNTRVYGPGGECYMLDKARDQRDKLKAELDSANWSLSRAKESLRASEQEVEEIDTLCNDFRRANARLVADLAAAMQRADTAEAILRARA